MDTEAHLKNALERYFSAWTTTDGPWWEADAVLGIYRCLDPQLQQAVVTVPDSARKDLIWFLGDAAWGSVSTPRVAAENYIPTNGPVRILRADLCCRSQDGMTFDWLAEVKLWSENHVTAPRAQWSLEARLLYPMLLDYQKWVGIAASTPRFFIGLYAQSPGCTDGKHCKSLDALADECEAWLVSHLAQPACQGQFHIGLKQRVDGQMRSVRIVADLSSNRPLVIKRVSS